MQRLAVRLHIGLYGHGVRHHRQSRFGTKRSDNVVTNVGGMGERAKTTNQPRNTVSGFGYIPGLSV